MGKWKQSLIVGIALLVVAGVLFLERRAAPDEAGASGSTPAVNHSSPGSGKSGESRRDGSTREKNDKYYYPSSGHRTVPDEVGGLLAPDGSLTDRAAVYFGLDEEKRSQVNSLMKSKLEEEFGASHVESFVAAMNDREYGGFGRFDGRIQILSKEGEGQVLVEWSDPLSGSRSTGDILNFSQFDARYGAAFRLAHASEFSPEPGP